MYLHPEVWEAMRYLLSVCLERPVQSDESIAKSLYDLADKIERERESNQKSPANDKSAP